MCKSKNRVPFLRVQLAHQQWPQLDLFVSLGLALDAGAAPSDEKACTIARKLACKLVFQIVREGRASAPPYRAIGLHLHPMLGHRCDSGCSLRRGGAAAACRGNPATDIQRPSNFGGLFLRSFLLHQ